MLKKIFTKVFKRDILLDDLFEKSISVVGHDFECEYCQWGGNHPELIDCYYVDENLDPIEFKQMDWKCPECGKIQE